MAGGAMKECYKGKTFLSKGKFPKLTNFFFANLHVPTLIASFCGVAFKIKPFLSMVSSMYVVTQR
jgi:hypothetical protein